MEQHGNYCAALAQVYKALSQLSREQQMLLVNRLSQIINNERKSNNG